MLTEITRRAARVAAEISSSNLYCLPIIRPCKQTGAKSATAPVGNSPTIAPTRLIAIAIFIDVKRKETDDGSLSEKGSVLDEL